MAKVPPFYTFLKRTVHHDNDLCTFGKRVAPKNKVPGRGGLPLCKQCADLDLR
jgi:hypothetical protein